MGVHELAGKPAPRSILVNIPRLISAYYTHKPDASDPAQRVVFGTSGHRGSSFRNSFNEGHILAISQAICEYRKSRKISGPLFKLGEILHAFQRPLRAKQPLDIDSPKRGGVQAMAKFLRTDVPN